MKLKIIMLIILCLSTKVLIISADEIINADDVASANSSSENLEIEVEGKVTESSIDVENNEETVEELTTFTLTNIDENGNPVYNSIFEIYDKDDNLVTTGVTNELGQLTVKDLPIGEYYTKQISVGELYAPNNAALFFIVNSENNGSIFVNSLARANIKISASTDSGPLADVEYVLVDNSSSKVTKAKTNANGIARLNNIVLGNYIIKESDVPDRYNSSTKEQNLTLQSNGEQAYVSFSYMFDQQIDPEIDESIDIEKSNTEESTEQNKGIITIKSISEDGSPNVGIEYGIYDENGKLVEILVIDENGYAKSGKLPYGNYYIKNLSSLDEKSYSLSLNDKNESILYEVDNTQSPKEESKEEVKNAVTTEENSSNVNATRPKVEEEVKLAKTGVNFITSIYLLLSAVTIKLVFRISSL